MASQKSIEEIDTDVSDSEATEPPSKKRRRKATPKARSGEINNEHFLAGMKDSKFSLVRAIRGIVGNPTTSVKLIVPFTVRGKNLINSYYSCNNFFYLPTRFEIL